MVVKWSYMLSHNSNSNVEYIVFKRLQPPVIHARCAFRNIQIVKSNMREFFSNAHLVALE